MRLPSEITITEEHKKLLHRMYIGWDDCEYGAPAVDCKRPYGNGDVEGDIAEILGWEVSDDDYEPLTDEQRERARTLHGEMQAVLQVVVQQSDIPLGTYTREQYGATWTARGRVSPGA